MAGTATGNIFARFNRPGIGQALRIDHAGGNESGGIGAPGPRSLGPKGSGKGAGEEMTQSQPLRSLEAKVNRTRSHSITIVQPATT